MKMCGNWNGTETKYFELSVKKLYLQMVPCSLVEYGVTV